MKTDKTKTSFSPCRTIPQALTFLYLITFFLLLILGLILVFATGFSFWKLAVCLLLSGSYLISLVIAVLASRNMPKKRRIRKYRKLLAARTAVGISDLAEQTGLEEDELRAELLLLIEEKVFPDGSFSEDGTFFYPDDSYKKQQGKDTL